VRCEGFCSSSPGTITPMRRKEREITEQGEIDELLGRAKICRVAFAIENEPYIVPLSHGYDSEAGALFFHTAKEGRKIECIAANPRVCFEVEGDVEVEAGDERACSWGLCYESVIGYGTIFELVSREERESALRCMMRQQSEQEMDWAFEPKMAEKTRLWRLDIESAMGKRSFKPRVVEPHRGTPPVPPGGSHTPTRDRRASSRNDAPLDRGRASRWCPLRETGG